LHTICQEKKVNNKEFSDYAEKWDVADALGCFLDLDLYTVSFSRNGTWLQVAYVIPEQFRGKFFFPHICLKNTRCKVNFGEKAAVTPIPQGYEWVAQASEANASEGPKAATSRKECEVIFTIGLPLSGKTVWTKKYVKEHPEKHYTVVGADHIYERMKPWLFPDLTKETKETDKEKEKIVQQNNVAKAYIHAGSVMGFMLRLLGEQGPRNYIIDAANSTRSRNKKLGIFSGYGKKIAVVFTPPYSELEKRIEESKKNVNHPPCGAPDRSEIVARQLGRFILPEDTEDYDETIYADSSKEEVKKIVDQYAEEGKKLQKEKPELFRYRRRGGFRGGFRGGARGGGRGGSVFRGKREREENVRESGRSRGSDRGRGSSGSGSRGYSNGRSGNASRDYERRDRYDRGDRYSDSRYSDSGRSSGGNRGSRDYERRDNRYETDRYNRYDDRRSKRERYE